MKWHTIFNIQGDQKIRVSSSLCEHKNRFSDHCFFTRPPNFTDVVSLYCSKVTIQNLTPGSPIPIHIPSLSSYSTRNLINPPSNPPTLIYNADMNADSRDPSHEPWAVKPARRVMAMISRRSVLGSCRGSFDETPGDSPAIQSSSLCIK